MGTRIEGRRLIVEWHAADGYISGGRTHDAEIDLDELDGLSESEIEEVIDDAVTHEFQERVHAGYDLDDAIRLLRERAAAK